MLDIKVGSGDIIVCGIAHDGNKGIAILDAKEHGEKTDTPVSLEITKEKKFLAQIWFADIKSARLFQDQINSVCLRMNGYNVENAG